MRPMTEPKVAEQNGVREMTDEEIIDVFETLDLPLTPPAPTPQEAKPLLFFPVSGDSPRPEVQ